MLKSKKQMLDALAERALLLRSFSHSPFLPIVQYLVRGIFEAEMELFKRESGFYRMTQEQIDAYNDDDDGIEYDEDFEREHDANEIAIARDIVETNTRLLDELKNNTYAGTKDHFEKKLCHVIDWRRDWEKYLGHMPDTKSANRRREQFAAERAKYEAFIKILSVSPPEG